MPDYPHAIEAYVDRSRVFINQNDHQAIVLHGTAGGSSAQAIANFFATEPNMTSSHYVVGQDGSVVQCVRECDGSAANCCLEPGHDPFWDQWGSDNMNLHTLSIEHVINDVRNALSLTDAQKQASFKLVAYLCQKYHISLDHIKGHYTLDPLSRKDCPGPYFPWDELMTFLKGEDSMTIDLSNPAVANYFQASGNTWQCKKNGNIVLGAILTFYKQFGNNANCGLTYAGLPETNEMDYTTFRKVIGENTSLKIGAPANVRFQKFERVWLCYDPSHWWDNPPGSGDVYLPHIPQSADVSALQARLQQIEKIASGA